MAIVPLFRQAWWKLMEGSDVKARQYKWLPGNQIFGDWVRGIIAVCVIGVMLTGCVAYNDGGYYGTGYYGGDYYGGGNGGTSVKFYAPPRYRDGGYRHRHRHRH